MMYFIVLVALIAASTALPVNNFTNSVAGRTGGFADFGGGTYGGQGGSVYTVHDAWALRDAILGDSVRVVNVVGRIDLTALFTGSPGVVLQVGSYKTIQSAQQNQAEICGGGFKVYQGRQVLFYNLRITNALNYAPGEQPDGNGGIISMVPGEFSQFNAIDIDGSENVWVDHITFSNDPWNAASIPTNQRRHHSTLSVKLAANYITVSNCHFRNIDLNILVGHDDSSWQDNGKLKTTFYGNYFQGVVQRNPRVRFGEVHIYNNLYTDIPDYGIGIGVGARIYAERNVFINTYRAWAIMSTNQNPAGYCAVSENSLQSSTVDSGVSSNIGWHPNNYYSYSTLATNQVEESVRRYAGYI